MKKGIKNSIIYSNKKSNKNIIYENLSPRMRDPAFQINYTLKQYVDRKLNENILNLDKELFKKKKNNNKKLKSFHNKIKRNRENNYTTTNVISKENLPMFSSLQNLSISIVNSNNKNNIIDDNKLFKNMTYKKTDNTHKIFSYTKINDKRIKMNARDLINKSNHKIKFNLSGKISRINVKNISKKYTHSSSMKNIKIKENENKMNKTNINNSKEYSKTLFRFNSTDFKNIKNNNTNLNNEKREYIKDNILSLSQKINHSLKKKNKNNVNKSKISPIKNKIIKKNTKISKKLKKVKTKKIKGNDDKKEIKKVNNKDLVIKGLSRIKNIKTEEFNNNINNANKKNIIDDTNNYYLPSLGKTESINNSSILNLHLNDQKILDGYELYWNLKNDYSKDIDISLISINNKKASFIKNYKLSPNKFTNNYNDNNINNIYLNNIQNVNNINNKENDIINRNNKEEYYSKLELLENENILLKNEIKESKNRISILEYKIEELLDDKNSKENSECPQPTPYVIKYSKDIIPIKNKPKIEENSQEQNLKSSNEILKEYSKNETKESDASNRIINKNEDEIKN